MSTNQNSSFSSIDTAAPLREQIARALYDYSGHEPGPRLDWGSVTGRMREVFLYEADAVLGVPAISALTHSGARPARPATELIDALRKLGPRILVIGERYETIHDESIPGMPFEGKGRVSWTADAIADILSAGVQEGDSHV